VAESISLLVHATHEAGIKMGGIGAVLAGPLGAKSYNGAVRRTVVAGPMDAANPVETDELGRRRARLLAAGTAPQPPLSERFYRATSFQRGRP
jgi:hypothetical protein